MVGRAELRDELASEDPTEDLHREEKVRSAGDPSRAALGQPAAGDYAVQVRMVLQVLPPSVQHSQKADSSTEVFLVGRHLQKGLGGRPEEHPVEFTPVAQSQLGQRLGQREHDVEVRHVQQLRLARFEPTGARRGLALRAVAVAAGIVGMTLEAAAVAGKGVSTQDRRATGGDVRQRPALFGRERRAVGSQEGRPIQVDHIGHFDAFGSHGATA